MTPFKKFFFSSWGLSIAILAALVAASAFFASRRATSELEVIEGGALRARDQQVEIGGVRRPLSDVRSLKKVARDPGLAVGEDVLRASRRFPYGTTPKLAPDLNASVANAVEALQSANQDMPERLSAIIQPAAFDLLQYQRNKQAYLEVSEPGRVWQTAQPGEGVPVLAALGSTQHRMRQGETIRLRVESAPESPVTFTSFDLGAFSNGLTSITVEADADGLAVAAFTAPPGTAYLVDLLAGSPLASGQVDFRVLVIPPNP
jgi:hypothetical protein